MAKLENEVIATEDMEQTREAWDGIAAGYDAYVTPSHIALGKEALRLAGLRAGLRFLDVACGSGALAIPAARLGAEVTAVDLSPGMVARLEDRARAEGLTNLRAAVMDGHALDLDDDSFDVAGSQFGVMLFPDLPRGLREMVRVTRPGGRVVMVVLAPPPAFEFLHFFLEAIKAAVPGFPGLPTDPPPQPFQVADPRVLRRRMEEAGLRDVQVETTVEELEVASGSEVWEWLVHSNPIGAGLAAGVPLDRAEAAREVLEGMIRERAGGRGPAVLRNTVRIGVGRV